MENSFIDYSKVLTRENSIGIPLENPRGYIDFYGYYQQLSKNISTLEVGGWEMRRK